MDTMEALVFDARPARLIVPSIAALVSARAVMRVGPPARLATVPFPAPPSPQWAHVRPLAAGICGSDLVQVGLQAGTDNPLSGLLSFPHVMGHEIVAEVLRAAEKPPPGAPSLHPGDLVCVDPWLGCDVVGAPAPCAGCAQGLPPLCEHHGDAAPGHGRGIHLGNVRGLPGGFAPLMTVHALRLHPLPPDLSPTAGVLADPVAVALHAVDRADVRAGAVLVLGAGTIGLAVTAVLRARHPEIPVLVTARWPHTADEVRRLGAAAIEADGAGSVEAVRRATGGTLRRPWRGQPWISGGSVTVVIDTIGSSETIETGLRAAAARARIVVVGVHRPRRTENTLLYFKEIEMRGSNGYGRLQSGRHAIDVAMELIAGGQVPYDRWLTHRFPLQNWRAAFLAAMSPGSTGAIKVSLEPGVAPTGATTRAAGEPH